MLKADNGIHDINSELKLNMITIRKKDQHKLRKK
jgi:hypothetical protein